jgi:hypothetical protein
MKTKRPVESLIFEGMADAVRLQTEAAAVSIGNTLTSEMLEPLGNINTKAAELEMNSPLFYGKVQPTLFGG